jgi:hypothetical protein
MTTEEVCDYLGVSMNNLNQIQFRGHIKWVSKEGKRVFYNRADVEAIKRKGICAVRNERALCRRLTEHSLCENCWNYAVEKLQIFPEKYHELSEGIVTKQRVWRARRWLAYPTVTCKA